MSNDNVKTMVDSLADGDNIAAQDAFKNALTDSRRFFAACLRYVPENCSENGSTPKRDNKLWALYESVQRINPNLLGSL